jgi:phosphopantothenoylcysteine synthetase/decarboxylase
MRVIVTCGPSYEPIDFVRRLTNFSTGELGLMLAAQMARAGHTVTCLKGIGATVHLSSPRVEVVPFSTNDDLMWKLTSHAGKVDVLFHTAALCDYRVQSIHSEKGEAMSGMGKLPTREGNLLLTLEPTTKVLPQLRGLFPTAKLVGWKYEIEGERNDVVAKAQRQLEECKTDACVVNGAAWGEGFGFITPNSQPTLVPDKNALCEFLSGWVVKTTAAPQGTQPPPPPAPQPAG